MFSKIEKSFTRYSLLILSLVVLMSFIGLYFFVRTIIYQDIHRELSSMGRLLEPKKGPPNSPQKEEDLAFPEGATAPPRGFVALTATATPEIFSPFDERFKENIPYQPLVTGAVAQNKGEGEIKVDSGLWAYKKVADHQYHFVEISSQTRILSAIIGVGAVVYLLLLVVLWQISRRFAKVSVQPARDAYQRQTQFIANVSHELKTPLAIIQTNAEALSLQPEDENNRWLHNIHTEIQRMDQLISHMVSVSLSPTGAKETSSFDLSQLALEVLLPFEPLLYEKNILLEANLPKQIVTSDPEQLKRALYLLLENAVKYTPEGGKITLSAPHTPSLSISNTGGGLTSEEEEKVFERFYRGDASRNKETGGYGLGLPIARQIVQELGGELTLSVTEDITFTMTF